MTELDRIIEERNAIGAKMITPVFKIIALLLCPIALVLYFGGKLDANYEIGKIPVFISAISALSLSWIAIWSIYIKVDTQMQNLDTKIRLAKDKEGYDPDLNKKRQEAYDREDANEKDIEKLD